MAEGKFALNVSPKVATPHICEIPKRSDSIYRPVAGSQAIVDQQFVFFLHERPPIVRDRTWRPGPWQSRLDAVPDPPRHAPRHLDCRAAVKSASRSPRPLPLHRYHPAHTEPQTHPSLTSTTVS